MPTHYPFSSIYFQSRTLLSLSLLFHIATSFVINVGNTSSVDGRLSQAGDDVFCADSPEWEYQGDQESDCIEAIAKLHDYEVKRHGDHHYEFVADGSSPHISLAIAKTPRKYMHGECSSSFPVCFFSKLIICCKDTCTVAIVVLNFFEPGELPGIKPQDWGTKATSDLASYKDIWRAAKRVELDCVRTARKSGWHPVGESDILSFIQWRPFPGGISIDQF